METSLQHEALKTNFCIHLFMFEISNNTEHVQYKNSNIRDEFFEINQVVSDGLVNCNTPFIVCNTKSEHQDICSK